MTDSVKYRSQAPRKYQPAVCAMARGPVEAGRGVGGMSATARKAETLFETSTIAEIREASHLHT